jgi:hypothetical protein
MGWHEGVKVLVACEFTGTVRDAFAAAGHEATSSDLLPTEAPGEHYQGDVRDILDQGWDLMVAHPPCTYLAQSGVRWLVDNMDRWRLMQEAAAFFRLLYDAPIQKIAIENPVIHGYGLRAIGINPTQRIQPWQFGHPEQKTTVLWLRGLPPLQPETSVGNAVREMPYNQRAKAHLAPESKDRWKIRSATYQGIADAMANQWGE